MKRNLSIYSILLLFVCILTGSSCKKILEQTPRNAPYDEVFWQTGRDYSSAIAGNYALLRKTLTDKNNRYYMYGDAIAKNYFTIDYTGDGLEGIQNGDFTFKYNVTSLADWTLFYKTITMSNLILAKLNKSTDADFSDVDGDIQKFKNKIKGQALFIRALTYFQMTKVWGDVPLVIESYSDPLTAPHLPRTPAADVLKQIEKDGKEAAALLDWGYTEKSERAVTANRGSVYALLTHLYLWRATMTNVNSNIPNAEDVNSADTTLTKLLAQGGYSYTDTSNYYMTFIGRNNTTTSSEGIFQLYMDDRTQEGSNAHIGLEFLRGEEYVAYFGNNARFWVPTAYFNNNYRFWYWNPNAGTSGEWQQVVDTLDLRYRKNFDYVHSNEPMCRKYSNVVYRNPGQHLDAYLSNDMVIFRYSDMKLLQAEIALYKNDLATAIQVINDFRDRNGADPYVYNRVDNSYTRDDLMYEYIKERGKELYVEGHIFYDLLRTRQYPNFVDWLTEDRFAKKGFYWPINPGLFKENRFLVQTSYWLGKI
ncbi:RagB/SusD family nutrient uptake outer membrane protein [Pseudoflavitalea sp. X16]|uniref:RagB/SusD family nutrient uptake outer membrane protein n=1 Tax=Paraflavitalea devenefica TaxID=2716334 RepID=UPI001424A379|nr:RagB/SusD family nutrient uptake outer membrane protein [Paraflavitalea devenefica]NII28891.1 RagB/SusD family nutrient uptake outer membrane protein [Paraflavitalea devenefica]